MWACLLGVGRSYGPVAVRVPTGLWGLPMGIGENGSGLTPVGPDRTYPTTEMCIPFRIPFPSNSSGNSLGFPTIASVVR